MASLKYNFAGFLFPSSFSYVTFLSSPPLSRWSGWRMKSPLIPTWTRTLTPEQTTTWSFDRHVCLTPGTIPVWLPTLLPREGACLRQLWFMVGENVIIMEKLRCACFFCLVIFLTYNWFLIKWLTSFLLWWILVLLLKAELMPVVTVVRVTSFLFVTKGSRSYVSANNPCSRY